MKQLLWVKALGNAVNRGKSFDIAVFLHNVPDKILGSRHLKSLKERRGNIQNTFPFLPARSKHKRDPVSPFPRKLLSLFIRLETLL